jgi:electron transfer flavoprotein alpha subunit
VTDSTRDLQDASPEPGAAPPSTSVVVAEIRGAELNAVSLEAVAAAQQLGAPTLVVVPGDDVGKACEQVAGLDVADVVALEHPALGAYTPDGYLAALAPFLRDAAQGWVLFAHTYQVRDYVPALATRLGRPLVADCTSVRTEGGGVVLTRPLFRGKITADVVPSGGGACLVTFQVGAFRADAVRRGQAPAPIRRVAADVDAASIRQRPEPPFREARQAVDLTKAERIVAVGRGIKDRDHLRVAEALAAALGAELAASRPICDAGWLPMDRQIGSSGQTVAPKLYVALGISGAIQHIVGMKGARTIVAINKDADAPIFEVADYGIVGDIFEVVPAMVAALKD